MATSVATPVVTLVERRTAAAAVAHVAVAVPCTVAATLVLGATVRDFWCTVTTQRSFGTLLFYSPVVVATLSVQLGTHTAALLLVATLAATDENFALTRPC